ncbi:hypothetical protein [Pseudomonas putida]|uniref:Uncharacterized protein n=1 Tax=Pseudomonas putida TaxID=303 RepID=A0A2S3WFR3_PSEPU|nr:hypothetical protein [Pseudomonas putida]POF89755.1 hypothetical protein BGP80_18010 [Pseudomonas putida]
MLQLGSSSLRRLASLPRFNAEGTLSEGSEIAAMRLSAYAREITATTRISSHHVADLQMLLVRAGVVVYPGNIIVGYADGLTVVPAHLAEVCSMQDDIEGYLAMRIAPGEALWSVYPPTPASVSDYHAWVAAGRSLTARSAEPWSNTSMHN